MIKSIYLKNWRSHKESYISFSTGTNLIIGRMGGGKTSIVDGICFALFGTCPSLQQRKITLNELIRNRPTPQDEAIVVVEIEYNGNNYKIMRKIRKNGKNVAELSKNDVIIVTSPEQVNKYIEDLLEINYDLFTRAIYTEQNRIDYFLSLQKKQRKEQIDELLGLSKFEEIRQNVVKLINRLNDRLADKESMLSAIEVEKIITTIKELKDEREEISKNLIKISKNLEEVEKRFIKTKKEYEEQKEIKERYESLKNEISAIESSLIILKEEVKDESELTLLEKSKALEENERIIKNLIKEKEKEKNELNERNNYLAKKIFQIESIKKEIEKIDGDLKELKIAIDSILNENKVKNFEEFENKLNELEKENELLSKKISEKNAEKNEKLKVIRELEKEIDKCPICDSNLSNEKRNNLKEKKEKELKKIEDEIKEIEEEFQKKKKEKEEMKKNYEKAQKLVIIVNEYERNLKRKNEEIKGEDVERYKNEEKNIREKIKKIEEEIEVNLNEERKIAKEIEKIKSLIYKFEKIKEINEKLEKKKDEFSKIKFDENEFKKIEDELKEVEKEKIRLTYEKKNYESKLNQLDERINEKLEEMKKVEKIKKECERIKKEIEKFQILQNAIVETQYILREELMNAINNALEKIWYVLYPYSDYPTLQLLPSEEKDDYELVFKVQDRLIKVDGIASGGERALACLALRIALSMVLTPKLSWLILDEPTHNLDEEGIKALNVVLHDHVPKLVEQIFLITHDENLKDAVSGKMIKVERSKEVPEVSNVEEFNLI